MIFNSIDANLELLNDRAHDPETPYKLKYLFI